MQRCQIGVLHEGTAQKSAVFGVIPREGTGHAPPRSRCRDCRFHPNQRSNPLSHCLWSPPKARLTAPIKRRLNNTQLLANCCGRKAQLDGKFSALCGFGIKPGHCSCQLDLGVLGNHPAVKNMLLAARAFTSPRKKAHSMCWRSQPVQHMTTQRVAFGTRQVIEILARVATHTEPFIRPQERRLAGTV
jgi:hypothetical protein